MLIKKQNEMFSILFSNGFKTIFYPVWTKCEKRFFNHIKTLFNGEKSTSLRFFKRLKTREDSSDLDENLTELIAAAQTLIFKTFARQWA